MVEFDNTIKNKISVLVTTYNHITYIRQALEGFISQKTNFPFEVLIHDDASTDGTVSVIKEYQKKYPDIIKPVYQKENQWSKGIDVFKTFLYPQIKSQYVALCEGDDYWTDPLKLQKQVDFLDAHPECSICFHPVKVVWEDKSQKDRIFPTPSFRFRKKITTLQDLLKHNYIQTNSVVYRWRFHKDSLNLIPDDILPGDYFLHLLHAQTGKIGFIDDVMAVYRKHAGGLWWNVGKSDEWFLKCGYKHMNFYRALEKQFRVSRQKEIETLAQNTIHAAIKNGRFDILQNIYEKYSGLYKKYFHEKIFLQNGCTSKKEKNIFYLFGFIPIYKNLKTNIKTKHYLFNIPIISITKRRVKILGITIISIKHKT